MRSQGILFALFQLGAHRLFINCFQIGVEIFQGLELGEQRHRCFVAHALHPGDVVRRIPTQGFVVHHLAGQDAHFVLHFLDSKFAGLGIAFREHAAEVEDGRLPVLIHQLKQVAIARQNLHPIAVCHGLPRQGANHVVRFIAWNTTGTEVERLQHLLQVLQVGEEIFGGFRTSLFVAVVGFVAEGLLCGVEGDRHVLRALNLHHVQQRFQKAVGHAGRNSCGGAQATVSAFGMGKVGAKGEGMSVDEDE